MRRKGFASHSAVGGVGSRLRQKDHFKVLLLLPPLATVDLYA
jgi:hypothetical protein